jgi:hypothetical protein
LGLYSPAILVFLGVPVDLVLLQGLFVPFHQDVLYDPYPLVFPYILVGHAIQAFLQIPLLRGGL